MSHDTVLDKLREANIVSNEVSNEEEKNKIAKETEEFGETKDPNEDDKNTEKEGENEEWASQTIT